MAEMSDAETTADPCCAPEAQASRCEPSAKAECCGARKQGAIAHRVEESCLLG
jgi:hypothetical protein